MRRPSTCPLLPVVALSAMALAAAALVGCTSVRVQTDYDPTASFAHFRTWSWLSHPKPKGNELRVYNDIMDARVRLAVERNLAAKGYTRVDDGGGEFAIGWHGAVEDKLSVQTVNDHYGHIYGYSGGVAGITPASRTYVREYEQGTLVLDVVDRRSKKLVWRGWAQAELSRSTSQHAQHELVQKAIDKMFADFPPS